MKKIGIILCVLFILLIIVLVFYNREVAGINKMYESNTSSSYGLIITKFTTLS